MTTTNKYKFIIVEGPDCSGKSTLVERLKNTLRWDSKYLRHAKGNQFFRYLQQYSLGKSTVFDRAHFSEVVYSRMWRGGSPFSKREKQILDDICTLHGLVIFCLPRMKIMERRYNKRGFEQQITIEELDHSYQLFTKESESAHLIYRSESYEELENLLLKVKDMVL